MILTNYTTTLSHLQALIFINCFYQTHHFHLIKTQNTVHISQQPKNQLKTVKTCCDLNVKMKNGNTKHQSHTTFNVHDKLHVLIQHSFHVSYSTCMFHIKQLEPWHDIKTEKNFKFTLNLTNIPLKMFLDVCLEMNMKIQTQQTFSEIIFSQFVLVLTLFAYYPRFRSFLCVHMLPFFASAQDHHTRCNTHGHQFLEKQLTGVRNTDLGNLERKIRTL